MPLTINHAKTVTIPDPTQADLNAQIALGNYPAGTLLANISLASDWNAPLNVTGSLDVANGGTGATSFTANRILIGDGTNPVTTSANFTFNTSTNVFSLTGSQSITAGSSSTVPFVINMAASNTANVANFRDSSGNVQLCIDNNYAIATTSTSTSQQVTIKSRTNMGSVGGNFTFKIQRDGSNNAGNGCIMQWVDNGVTASIALMARGFTQNVMDWEFNNGTGICLVMPSSGGNNFYNNIQNTQDIGILRIKSNTMYPGGGTPSPQGLFKTEICPIAATSPISLADVAAYLGEGAPTQGVNMTITRRYNTLLFAGDAGGIPLGIRLASSQTADAFEIRDSSANLQFSIAANGRDFILDTTTGTKIGTATTQKLGFYNSTPITQPSSTTDLRQALIDLGLYAPGGATPLDLNAGALRGYSASTNTQTGTSYTLVASDTGRVVTLSDASAITLTLPNSLPAGFVCTVIQKGAGQVTFSAASGATLRNRQSHTKTAGQYAVTTLYVDSNSGGSAADYYLAGDTAA